MELIKVENLSKDYGNFLAVDDISFTAEQDTILGLLGPNGAGKSTCIKVMTCYLPLTSGNVWISGTSVLENPLEVKRKIGYMPENLPIPITASFQDKLPLAC